MYRADVLTGATSRPPNPNIRRGLFRLWLVLSVLWLIGVGFAYRPPACRYTPPDSSVRAVSPHDLRQCIGFIYERAVLHSIPARLAAGQEGLPWHDLTNAQQTFAIYSWRTPEGILSPAQAEKRYGLALYDGVNPPTGSPRLLGIGSLAMRRRTREVGMLAKAARGQGFGIKSNAPKKPKLIRRISATE